MKTVFSVSIIALAVSVAANASEDLDGSSYQKELYVPQKIKPLGSEYTDGLSEEDLLVVEEAFAEPTNKQTTEKTIAPIKAQEKSSAFGAGLLGEYPIKLSTGLEWRNFEHKNNMTLNYPNIGNTRVDTRFDTGLINLYVEGQYVYQNKHIFEADFRVGATSSTDYDIENVERGSEPSYFSAGAGYGYNFYEGLVIGGKVTVSNLDFDYSNDVVLNKNYNDSVMETKFDAYLGYTGQYDRFSWGLRGGLNYSFYDYESQASAGVTPGYTEKMDGTGIGAQAEARFGIAINKQLSIEARAGVIGKNLGVDDSKNNFPSSNEDLSSSEAFSSLGVSYKFGN